MAGHGAGVVPGGGAIANSPVTENDDTVSGPVPALLTTTSCTALLDPTACASKSREPGDTIGTAVTPAAPVPLNGTVRGLPGALSTITRLPGRGPAASGVNVTLIVHEASAASAVPHEEVKA